MVSITHYFYRKSSRQAIAAALMIFLSVITATAQRRTPPNSQQNPQNQESQSSSTTPTFKKAKRGPRAIAVLEFLPGGEMRLVPVALWIDGRYYDASLYGANPEPMAVEPLTVYEAQSLGEPTGTFTITQPRQVNGNWVADGAWRPHLAMDEDVAKRAAKDAASKPKANPSQAVFTGSSDDSRPVLKRAPGSGSDSGSSTQPSQSGTSADSDRPVMKRPASDSGSGDQSSSSTTTASDDRPVMKRPPSDSSSKPTLGSADDSSTAGSTTSAKSQTPTDDGDPNRPTMKRSSPTSASSSSSSDSSGPMPITQAAAASNDSDPNRPTLGRSKTPKPQMAGDPTSAKNDVPLTTNAKGTKAYPAISDASDYRGRPLLYSMSPGERQAQEQKVLKLAMDEIRAFAAKHNGPPLSKTATITDYDVRAFDLDYSSSPTIVLTAKLPVAPATGQKVPANFSYFVTLVARVDINDQALKIFSSVSDSRHLDAYPRMELIDAVDADANGRGDLLFRQYSDIGITYGLYRVSPYQLEKIFEGGSSL